MYNDELLWAQHDFNDAYKHYTEVSKQVSTAHSEEEKQREAENLRKASDRFYEAYKKLKALEETHVSDF